MLAKSRTCAVVGLDGYIVEVEVDISPGLPRFDVVGLPDTAVQEARERVRAAIRNSGCEFPMRRITVNLAPADVLKEGSHFDLPIALGLLVAMGVLPGDEIEGYTVLGELALDGAIAPVAGVLPAAIAASAAARGLICPAACGGEAAWAGTIEVLAPATILALINHFKGTQIVNELPDIARDAMKQAHL